jgi:cytoskeletal protein RodZ
MPTVGDQLRTAREAQKLTIQEVAEATNMRADHVRALERGDFSPFPAPVYVRGSVRTYAKLLKLEVMPIMEALTAELNPERHADGTGPGAGRRRGVLDHLALQLVRFGWKRTVLVLGVLLGVVLLVVWRGGRSPDRPAEDPLSDLPPPLYQPAGGDGGCLPLPGTNR